MSGCDLSQLEDAVEQCAELMAVSTSCEQLGEGIVEESAEALEEEAILLHYGFFLMTLMLTLGFLGGYVLERKHFTYVHEAGGHLLIGVFCGLVLNLQFGHSHESKTERQHEMINVARFDTEFFFLLLLPPIIFEAGYNMQRRKFFSNIGAICMYAFVGTSISTILIAGTIYIVSQASGSGGIFAATSDGEPFNGLESLIFGALISATDPVTVLAVFGAMGADLNLFSLVFGESVMNDAVAIVLYKALDGFNPSRCKDSCEVTGSSITAAFANFVYIFVGSVVVGTAIGLISALLYKHAKMYEEEFEHIEMILLVLFPYMSWMMAEALQLSGIVSILFCGILMAHYTTHNLSPETEQFSRRFFKTMAFGCESFVFIYMGLATFTYEQDWDHWPIIVVSIIAILLSRLFNVYPNSFLVNLYRAEEKKIPMSFQHIMWFSGLRGAIAFALGLEAAEGYAVRADSDSPGAGLCILTMTLSIVIFTVLAMGGAVYTVLNYFDAPECSVFEGPPVVESDGGKSADDDNKALGFDRKWFKPFFTWRYQDETKTTASERFVLGPPDNAIYQWTSQCRDPRWSSTNKSGDISRSHGHSLPETTARPVGDGNPESEGETQSLLTTSV